MTTGRKPIQSSIENSAENLPAETLSAIAHDMSESAALPATLVAIQHSAVALAKTLGYEGPLAPDLLEEGARESLTRINFEIFSLGARLLLLKAQCPHGEFMQRLEHLGVEYTMATRLMQATRKFPNIATSQHLAGLGKSKIFELAMLDDEEAEAFANGEEVRGITHDDAYSMSVSELRAALRKERADKEAEITKAQSDISGQIAAKDRLIADGKKRIAELVEDKNRLEGMTGREMAADIEHQLTKHTLIAIGSLIPVRKSVHVARCLDHCPQGLYVAMQGALDRVIAEAMSIATDYGIQLNLGLWPADDELDNPNAGEEFADPLPTAE